MLCSDLLKKQQYRRNTNSYKKESEQPGITGTPFEDTHKSRNNQNHNASNVPSLI